MTRPLGAAASHSSRACGQDVADSLEAVEDNLGRVWGVVSHLQGVCSTPEMREAHAAAQPTVVEASTKAQQSRPLFEAITDVVQSPDFHDVDEARQRVLHSAHTRAQLAGVGLVGTDLDRFNEIKYVHSVAKLAPQPHLLTDSVIAVSTLRVELAGLGSTFSNNVLDASAAWDLVVTDSSDVEGVPAAVRRLAAQSAEEAGHEGATVEAGPWRFTLDMPSYVPFMQHCPNPELREAAYRCVRRSLARAGLVATPDRWLHCTVRSLSQRICDPGQCWVGMEQRTVGLGHPHATE